MQAAIISFGSGSDLYWTFVVKGWVDHREETSLRTSGLVISAEDENQATHEDDKGCVQVSTIFPAVYPGRTRRLPCVKKLARASFVFSGSEV